MEQAPNLKEGDIAKGRRLETKKKKFQRATVGRQEKTSQETSEKKNCPP